MMLIGNNFDDPLYFLIFILTKLNELVQASHKGHIEKAKPTSTSLPALCSEVSFYVEARPSNGTPY